MPTRKPRTVTDFALVLDSPTDDINTVHNFIENVWESNPEVDAMDRLRFETALIELAANVIQHGGKGGQLVAKLTITVDDDVVRGQITDQSEPGAVELGLREMPDEYAESGRGIAFIQRLVDVLHYERRDDENLWMIEKRRTHG